MALTLFKTDSMPFQLMQNSWASQINPLLKNPSLQSIILQNVALNSSGINNVSHLLSRKLVGWRIVRRRQLLVTGTPLAYDIYDVQDSNQTPALTLALVCSQGSPTDPVLVDIEVF